MPVDRLSVTVPSELGNALRNLAKARGTTMSTVVTEAIAHQVRMAALDLALAEAERRFGPIPEHRIATAEKELLAAARKGRRPAKRRRRRAA